MGGAPKNDYPVTPDIDESDSFKVPAKTLADMINNTIFSASTEDDRHFLNGLLWKFEKDVFSMVATDGRRLALNSTKAVKAKKEFKLIVPSKILGELSRFIKNSGAQDKDEVTVGLASNQIGFKIGKTVFVSRLVEGNFPAYEQIIPKSHEISVDLSVAALMAVTKRAAVASNERTGSVKYTFKDGALVVNSSSQNMDFEDEIPAGYKGKEFSISFNPKFVMDILKVAGEGEVTAEFSSPATPALLRVKGKEGPLYIVMPLRTQGA
jgi:DNA polymerase-3 subunit beta